MAKEEKRRIATVRVRGEVHMKKKIKDTLKMLNLTRVNHCRVMDSRKEYLGMIKKVKDYVSWGEISPKIMKKLIEKRGRLEGNKEVTKEYLKNNTEFKSIKDFVKKFMNFQAELEDINIKPVFRLSPPRKGYERKGIKRAYSRGGALGYRGKEINKLLERMT